VPGEITIRRATPDDAAALLAHLKALVAEPGINIPLAPDEVTATLEQERDRLAGFEDAPRAILLVAERDGEVLGELTLRGISPRRAVMHVATLGMSVRADARGQGVGEALLEAALEWAPTAGLSRIELYVYARNAPALKLYEKHGFVTEGRRRNFIREGGVFLDDVVMAKLLA
jgi:putative acetyltransferase